MSDIDLTPFGFTPTENLAYGSLLELGPSSGYALAKALSIARANAYQALNGLVSKGGAVRTDEQPQRYRAERPDALLAKLLGESARRFDLLERQIAGTRPSNGESLVPVRGSRALTDMALRTAARESGDLDCVGPPEVIAELGPAWRHRSARGWRTRIWFLGAAADEDPASGDVAGVVDPELVRGYFGGPVFLMLAGGEVAILVATNDERGGYWTSDPTIVSLVRVTLDLLTR